MSWMGGLGWKEGLSGVQMQKVKFSMNTITQKLSQNDNFSPQVEELEKSLSRAVGASQQKQQQLDSLNQGLEKIKRKVSKVFCICRLSKGLILESLS